MATAAVNPLGPKYDSWLKVLTLVHYGGREVCLDILHRQEGAPFDGAKLYQLFWTKQPEFQKLLKKRILKQDQYNLVFPTNQITNTAEFDITLFTFVISVIYGKKYKTVIDDLRKLRNSVFHKGNTSFTDLEFNNSWAYLTNKFHSHGLSLSLIADLKTCALDAQSVYRTSYMEALALRNDFEIDAGRKRIDQNELNIDCHGQEIVKNKQEIIVIKKRIVENKQRMVENKQRMDGNDSRLSESQNQMTDVRKKVDDLTDKFEDLKANKTVTAPIESDSKKRMVKIEYVVEKLGQGLKHLQNDIRNLILENEDVSCSVFVQNPAARQDNQIRNNEKFAKLKFKEYKTRFPKTKAALCEKFEMEYNGNLRQFLSLNNLGFIYNKNIDIEDTGQDKTDLYIGYSTLQDGEWICIKRVKDKLTKGIKDDTELKTKIHEIEILDYINANVFKKNDNGIIDLIHYTFDENFYYIVTPFYDYTLVEFLKTKPDFSTRVDILEQLLDAIELLHAEKLNDDLLLHKDIKPENVMLQKNSYTEKYHVKLVNFGESFLRESSQTKTQSNCRNIRWLPPGIKIGKNSRFTHIHESFVVCMLAVYILSNGEHPFLNPDDDDDDDLKFIYNKVIENEKEKISIRSEISIDGDLVDFMNKTFNEFFPYFRVIKKDTLTEDAKRDFNKTLCVSKIVEELKGVHSYLSPNHTRAHRLLAMLPLSEKRNTTVTMSVPNCSIFSKHVLPYRFTTVDTKPDMALDDLKERLTEESNECEDSKQIYIFFYLLTHLSHDGKEDDDYFWMKASDKGDMGNIIKDKNDKPQCTSKCMYIGVLIKEIMECFKGKKELLTIVLLIEGCRTKKDLQISETSEPFPKNVVAFYSAKLNKKSYFTDDFATPSYFCDKLTDNIKPGESLKNVFDNTTEALNKIYVVKIEEGKYDICDKDEPVEDGKQPLYLFEPELFINCNECKKTSKFNCEECKKKLDFIF